AGALVAILVGLVVAVVFVRRQRRLADPLLDLSLFKNHTYGSAFFLSLLGGATMAGALLLINLYLQEVRGSSPLHAGLWLVPPALAMVFTIMVGSGFAQKVRPAYVMSAGMIITVIGYLLLTQVGSAGGVTLLIIGFAIANAGVGPATALGYNIVLGAAPPEKAGSASSIMETGGQLGIAGGIAIMGSIGAAVYRGEIADTLPAGVTGSAADAARESISGAVAAAAGLPSQLAGEVLAAARPAFVSGLHTVVLICALVFVGLAVLATAALRHVPPTAGQGGPGGAPGEGAGAGAGAAAGASGPESIVPEQANA
ncbi:MAG TPA: MFS transporter, partial [Pseudonocardiaceae bacterium]